MPTIDELPQASSVSDSDELVVSQTDNARKATRAQLLAGVQPALALPQNALLGRLSPGMGGPENIAIGANFIVGNGMISAPPPFILSALPAAGPLQPSDLVAVAQGGGNASANYSAFMGGLSGLSGINGSNLLVTATSGTGVRLLADILSDAISIESFGAIGDGVTDNTASFALAQQAGRPIRLDAKVYIVNGPLLINSSAVWLGVSDSTVVRRAQMTSQQPWLEFAGTSAFFSGIIFDQAGLAAADSPAVQIDASCLSVDIKNCQFLNARGASFGSGLLVSSGSATVCKLASCQFAGNALDGVTITGAGAVILRGCTAVSNTYSGIAIAPGVACSLYNNVCNSNGIGISVGSWQTGERESPSSIACFIENNYCSGNTTWGLAVAGSLALIQSNTLISNGVVDAGGGILARLSVSQVTANQVSGGSVGIDIRTSWSSLISANHVANTANGLLLGGCQNVVASSNFLLTNQWGVDVSAIEPTLSYSVTNSVSIIDNWIGFTVAQGGGVYVHDGCLGVRVSGNTFNGWGSAIVNQALWLHTDQAIVSGNSWNNQPRFAIQSGAIAGLSTLTIPDIADGALVTQSANPIMSLLTSHQADTLGEISFIRVADGGAGYTQAQVTILGTGRGAAAEAIVNQGQVVWIVMTNPGSGYGAIGNGATVTITGDGSGAAATAYVGLPVIEGRQLRLNCNCSVQLALADTAPVQQNWTNYAITIPAFGAVELEGVFGAWQAALFPATDYVLPTGDGGAIFQSVAGGNVTLRPSAGGVIQIASGAEPTGCTSSVGRGAPAGSVVAPPGSDFRNLDGGPGDTFWVKQTGTDSNGWAAVA